MSKRKQNTNDGRRYVFILLCYSIILVHLYSFPFTMAKIYVKSLFHFFECSIYKMVNNYWVIFVY